jgi:hypothetical protein
LVEVGEHPEQQPAILAAFPNRDKVIPSFGGQGELFQASHGLDHCELRGGRGAFDPTEVGFATIAEKPLPGHLVELTRHVGSAAGVLPVAGFDSSLWGVLQHLEAGTVKSTVPA